MRRIQRAARGFTLVEILVALGILAIVSVMAYRGLSSALDTTARLEDERTFWNRLSLAFVRMGDDLRQARARSMRGLDGGAHPAFDAQGGEDGHLEFTRGAGASAETPGGLARVGYELKDGTLWRLRFSALDRVTDADALRTALVSRVEDFRVRLYGKAGAVSTAWPTMPDKDALPRGIEITLRIAGRGEFTRTFSIHD